MSSENWRVSGGGRGRDGIVTVTVRCMDCHREETCGLPEPSSYHYGGGGYAGKVILDGLPYPEGWNAKINQLARCAACYERYLDRMRPVWAGQNAAKKASLSTLSPLSLLDQLMREPHPSGHTWDLLKALREKFAPPETADAVDPVEGSDHELTPREKEGLR